jgi:uncharacterized pyridoxamine 5'-phosphate oxidase family protein
MDYKNEFYHTLSKTNEIALATAVAGIPNVRIVNFCYDASKPGILYFTTDRKNQKVIEFVQNNNVAFTTVPSNGSSVPHVRSNHAVVHKSRYNIDEIKDLFIQKVPGYDEMLSAIGDTLDVFEIHIKDAFVIVDYETAGPVSFEV